MLRVAEVDSGVCRGGAQTDQVVGGLGIIELIRDFTAFYKRFKIWYRPSANVVLTHKWVFNKLGRLNGCHAPLINNYSSAIKCFLTLECDIALEWCHRNVIARICDRGSSCWILAIANLPAVILLHYMKINFGCAKYARHHGWWF